MLGIFYHDPVVLDLHIEEPLKVDKSLRKSSYFKANLAILKNKDNLLAMEVAWKDFEGVGLDPR